MILDRATQESFMREQLNEFLNNPIHDELAAFQDRLDPTSKELISQHEVAAYVNNCIKNETLLSQLKKSSGALAHFSGEHQDFFTKISKEHEGAKKGTLDIIAYFTKKNGNKKLLLPYSF